jgi:hypothetical protein
MKWLSRLQHAAGLTFVGAGFAALGMSFKKPDLGESEIDPNKINVLFLAGSSLILSGIATSRRSKS